MIVYFTTAIMLVLVSYAIAIYYGYATVRHLSLQAEHLSDRTRQMQSQLGRALLVQVCNEV